jgi:hypothetical protein
MSTISQIYLNNNWQRLIKCVNVKLSTTSQMFHNNNWPILVKFSM